MNLNETINDIHIFLLTSWLSLGDVLVREKFFSFIPVLYRLRLFGMIYSRGGFPHDEGTNFWNFFFNYFEPIKSQHSKF